MYFPQSLEEEKQSVVSGIVCLLSQELSTPFNDQVIEQTAPALVELAARNYRLYRNENSETNFSRAYNGKDSFKSCLPLFKRKCLLVLNMCLLRLSSYTAD